MSVTKEEILLKYRVTAFLGGGMEAQAYACEYDRVLKLYNNTTNIHDLLILEAFYKSLPRDVLSYRLPQIEWIVQEGDYLLTIEQRLPGVPMASKLTGLDAMQFETMMRRYIEAAYELSTLHALRDPDRYKLFDPHNLSVGGDWHQFLRRFMDFKLQQITVHLKRDVENLNIKIQQLEGVLAMPYQGDYCVVHGDFFPGNVLVDGNGKVMALIDFGLFTMYGDALFDIATGWVFFDMYDALDLNARERLLSIIIEKLGEQVRSRLYLYVLLYSLLSANTYSPECADGHYGWCVANLNMQIYWDGLA